jgi:hypothetical protein
MGSHRTDGAGRPYLRCSGVGSRGQLPINPARSRVLVNDPVRSLLSNRDHATTLRTLHQHEHAVEAPLRISGDRARLTGEERSRNRSQPVLDGNRQLDRLPLNPARAGTGHHSRPNYLARDNRQAHEVEHADRAAAAAEWPFSPARVWVSSLHCSRRGCFVCFSLRGGCII